MHLDTARQVLPQAQGQKGIHSNGSRRGVRFLVSNDLSKSCSLNLKMCDFSADLVPMFHFGENETFKPATGICRRRLLNMQVAISQPKLDYFSIHNVTNAKEKR